MGNDRLLLDTVLRNHLPSFIQYVFQLAAAGETFLPSWHIEAIAHALMRVQRGETKRLIIEMPPRSLKSICTSVAFVAFALGHRPTRKIICASYSAELAAKHSRDCRTVMKHPIYRRLFAEAEVSAEKDQESHFLTVAGGYRYATSVGGTLTGIGGDLIILDDVLNSKDANSKPARDAVINWFDNTVRSRLNNKSEDAIVVVAQRLHADDLSGHLRRQGGWEVLSFPAIAEVDETIAIGNGRVHHRKAGDLLDPRRDSMAVLEELKRANSASFSAQYQQRPVPPEGEIVKWSWFNQYSTVPMPPKSRIIQSWDTAIKNSVRADYSVCLTFAVIGLDAWLLDIFRAKLDFPSLRREVMRLAFMWRAEDILIEDQGAGSSLIAQLRDERIDGMPLPLPIRPEGDKVARLDAASSLIEQGRIFLPEQASWLANFRDELLQFPNGRHDDQVDALSQAIVWLQNRKWTRGSATRRSFFAPVESKKPKEWKWDW